MPSLQSLISLSWPMSSPSSLFGMLFLLSHLFPLSSVCSHSRDIFVHSLSVSLCIQTSKQQQRTPIHARPNWNHEWWFPKNPSPPTQKFGRLCACFKLHWASLFVGLRRFFPTSARFSGQKQFLQWCTCHVLSLQLLELVQIYMPVWCSAAFVQQTTDTILVFVWVRVHRVWLATHTTIVYNCCFSTNIRKVQDSTHTPIRHVNQGPSVNLGGVQQYTMYHISLLAVSCLCCSQVWLFVCTKVAAST